MARTLDSSQRFHSLSLNNVAPFIYRLDALLSAGSIGGTEPEVQPGIRTRHPHQLQPAGTDQMPVPPR